MPRPLVRPLFLLLLAALGIGSVDHAWAQSRPKVGLVLSGGGARGAAHIGVLKMLEAQRIPVDAIAGTSMGAVVGGLYASGLSSSEIEALIDSPEWRSAFAETVPRRLESFRRKTEDQRYLVKLPLGLNAGRFRLPRGLVSPQAVMQLLRRATLPVASVARFDDLPTRYRAVSTDLESGESVVLEGGDLATAMRASSSAPGVFAPIELDGRLLVDGGLADNLPVEVARSMGVDVLIVVDVGFPLRSRGSLDSATSISSQMLSIMVRRGSDAQRRKLLPEDVLLTPALGEDDSTFDLAITARAIGLGETAARDAAPRLAPLALDERGYAEFLARRAARRQPLPRIDTVRVAGDSVRYSRLLNAEFAEFAGTRAEPAALDAGLTTLFGRGNFEAVDYRLQPRAPDVADLELFAKRNSWGPNYVRFGLSLEDDFTGNANYNAAARFVIADISSLGAEWVWDVQVGSQPRVATEFHLPFGDRARWFLLPTARFELRNVPLFEREQFVADYRLRSTEYGLDVGRELANWGEVRAGVRSVTGHTRLRLGDPSLKGTDFEAREYYTRFSYDTLDDRNFPRQGQSLRVEWRGERRALGSDRDADVATVDWMAARSQGRDTAVLWTSFGTNFAADASNVRTLFPLGGFLNLSGLPRDAISGRHYAISRLMYVRKIGAGGEGFLNVPAYAGVAFEVGNVWDERRAMGWGSARKQGSAFFGFDTPLGPLYLGTGFGGADTPFYLFLGRAF